MSVNHATEEAISARLQAVGVDPTMIATVLQAVLGLLTQCRNRPATALALRSPGVREEVLVRRELQRELRENGKFVSRERLNLMVQQTLSASRESSEPLRELVLDHVSEFDTI
jgi:hypothetical protein